MAFSFWLILQCHWVEGGLQDCLIWWGFVLVLVVDRLIDAASKVWAGVKVDFCPEATTGLSLGFQPQVPIKYVARPEGAADSGS
jgi:hypothetical protein